MGLFNYYSPDFPQVCPNRRQGRWATKSNNDVLKPLTPALTEICHQVLTGDKRN